MGWSCRKEAHDVWEQVSKKCRENSGSSNMFDDHFFDTDNIEHEDGSITGEVFHTVGRNAHKVGDFKISGDGKTVTGPVYFTKLTV